jgi:hypothetical protein
MEVSENGRYELVATGLMQMGCQVSKAIGRNLRRAALVRSPTPVCQLSRTLLGIHMVGSGKWLVLLNIPARQPVKQRFVKEGIATLRSGHK